MPEHVAQFITISGRVQGVGFRPFVYRLAHQHQITGWVRNVDGAVEIHAEGRPAQLQRFGDALLAEAPPLSAPGPLAVTICATEHAAGFSILDSASTSVADIHLPPDGFVCADCLAELHDPANRRHRYPFINCTQCGPRYTLITALPYDRPNTAMRDFALCPDCRREYENPLDRRFHAEPIACPVCGPHLQFVSGEDIHDGDEAALAAAVAALRSGKIVAVKGVGGYHLLCDATRDEAVAALRARKPRPAKPLAVMFRDLAALSRAVHTTPELDSFLASPERPIVLLPKRADSGLSEHIAPGLAEVGCLLPYSPLHDLLLNDFGGPLVATSGNLSGEPVLTENREAQARLAHIADAFLHHDRPIVRPADDPVYRVIAGLPRPLRLGRGRAPLELELPVSLAEPVLALGSHMKNTLCLAWGTRAVVSPHIGELDTLRSLDTLAQVAADLQRLYRVQATRLIVDRHPGYGTRRYARDSGLALVRGLASPRPRLGAGVGISGYRSMDRVRLGRRRPRRGPDPVGGRSLHRRARPLAARRLVAAVPPARRRQGRARTVARRRGAAVGERAGGAVCAGAAAAGVGARPQQSGQFVGRTPVRCRRVAVRRVHPRQLRGRRPDAAGGRRIRLHPALRDFSA